MKKFLALALAAAMSLSLVACGGGSSSTPAASEPAGSGSASSSAPATDAADFKVGAIYINSKNDTAGYTFAHHNGITTAMEELGMSPDQLVIVDEVPEDYDAVSTAVDTLVACCADVTAKL